jgi:hypothetical protein
LKEIDMDKAAALGQPEAAPEAEPKETKPKEASEADDRKALNKQLEDQRQRRIAYLKTIHPDLPRMVEEWKRTYGIIDSQHLLRTLYIWRGLSRSEYIALMNITGDKWKSEEQTVDKCLLWPVIKSGDWVTLPAGLPSTLSDLILASSGFGPDDQFPVRL